MRCRTAFFLPHMKSIVLLLCRRSEHCIFGSFGHSEFQNGLRGDFDFLACRRIPADARLSLLLYEFAEARNREFTLLRFPIGEISERRYKVFDLLLADARFVGHLREDLGLGHLCHQNPPLKVIASLTTVRIAANESTETESGLER